MTTAAPPAATAPTAAGSAATASAALQQRLEALLGAEWAATVQQRYSEPTRHYHTLEHVAALLAVADENAASLVHRRRVELAIVFHDVVYDAKAGDNEEQSAALFATYAAANPAAAGDAADRAWVEAAVLATKRHMAAAAEAAASGDTDLALFLDADLSILAADDAAYDRYASGIRSEYSHYAAADYCRGRAAVLQNFLDAERRFVSPQFAKRDAAACANLRREIDSLTAESRRLAAPA